MIPFTFMQKHKITMLISIGYLTGKIPMAHNIELATFDELCEKEIIDSEFITNYGLTSYYDRPNHD